MYVMTAVVAAALLRPTLALLAALTVTAWLRRRRRPDLSWRARDSRWPLAESK